MDANAPAVVGMGVLRTRSGTVIRAFTGTLCDTSGVLVTANHNVDRLRLGDVIVVALPTVSKVLAGEAAEAAVPMVVAPLGTYPVDLNQPMVPGKPFTWEVPRWKWSHVALPVSAAGRDGCFGQSVETRPPPSTV
jgi:hypothetical protein